MTSVKSIIDKKRNVGNEEAYLQFPENIGIHGMLMVFRDYEYQRPGARSLLSPSNISTRSLNSLLFPIPSNLNDNNELRLSRSDLGVMGDMMTQQFANMSSVVDGKSSAVDSIMKSISDSPLNGTDAANAITTGDSKIAKDALYLLRNATQNSIGRNISIGNGTTPNPRSALSFEGSEFKVHSFQWTFMPRNERESETLRRIISFLKRMTLPSYGGNTIDGLYLLYPKTIDIFLVGVDENHFSKFKTGMVRTLNVNTAPQGISLLKGGKPSAVTIDMNIMEMDIHTVEDYEE